MHPVFYEEHGKFGLKTTSGKVLINPKFETYRPFSNGMAAVSFRKELSHLGKEPKIIWTYVNVFGIEMNKHFKNAPDFTGTAVIATDEYGHVDLIDKNGKGFCYDNRGCLDINTPSYTEFGFGLYGVYYERRHGVRSSSTKDCYVIINTNGGEAMENWKCYSISDTIHFKQELEIKDILSQFIIDMKTFFEDAGSDTSFFNQESRRLNF